MITGINLSETKDYVSQYDKSESKTIWKLGVLNAEIFMSLGVDKNTLKIVFEVVRFGLKGFENFKDSVGNDIKFSTISQVYGMSNYQVVAENIMKIIPPEIITELGVEILKISKLKDDEIKN